MNATITLEDGSEQIIPPAPRKRQCSVCGKALKPIFKATPDPEDWFWRECDTCNEGCCPECSEVNGDGVTECTDCYQSRKIRGT